MKSAPRNCAGRSLALILRSALGDFLGGLFDGFLSGTGGLGKSMMMRNLLLSAVDSFEDLNRIPFFIPLRDYKPGSSSLLEDVFAAVSPLWPEMTPPDLDALLAQGKALLLLDAGNRGLPSLSFLLGTLGATVVIGLVFS